MFDGNTTSAASLGKFCGHSISRVVSSQRFLTLRFTTDSDVQAPGFKLFYNFTSEDTGMFGYLNHVENE